MTSPQNIPRSALLLGLAGLVPFVWGALTTLVPTLGLQASGVIGSRFVGPYVQLYYGAVILSFMSGVLWGFATKADGAKATGGYILSVLPALWAFFMTGGGAVAASMNLIAGFVGLLLLDWQFWRQGLAPAWWMKLRVLLTAIVVLCLLTGVL
ncbi:MAG: DUF3429 domain-containing protein [Yoonia sp.]|uniref:DUF3429 domain-containing protein n=1 Tax=Yoonia sp. TaxID=2212373 RepID=UPI003267DECB